MLTNSGAPFIRMKNQREIFILIIITLKTKLNFCEFLLKGRQVCHGQGETHFSNGEKYVGQHLLGRRSGKGAYFWSDGSRYEGEWKDGEQHGRGIFFHSNGDRFEGHYVNGQRHGEGNYHFKQGRSQKIKYEMGKRVI